MVLNAFPEGDLSVDGDSRTDRERLFHFSDVGSGLVSKEVYPLNWFAVAGEDRIFLSELKR